MYDFNRFGMTLKTSPTVGVCYGDMAVAIAALAVAMPGKDVPNYGLTAADRETLRTASAVLSRVWDSRANGLN